MSAYRPPAAPGPGEVALLVVGMVAVAAGALRDGVTVALFLLVLLGLVLLTLVLPRLVRVPAGLHLWAGAVLLAAATAATADVYRRIGWLDLPVHAVVNGVLAALALVVLDRGAFLPPGSGTRSSRPRLAAVVHGTSCGTLLAVLWELGEWFGHTVLDDRIGVGYDDTVGDLAAGGLGSLLAVVLVVASGAVPGSTAGTGRQREDRRSKDGRSEDT